MGFFKKSEDEILKKIEELEQKKLELEEQKKQEIDEMVSSYPQHEKINMLKKNVIYLKWAKGQAKTPEIEKGVRTATSDIEEAIEAGKAFDDRFKELVEHIDKEVTKIDKKLVKLAKELEKIQKEEKAA